MQEVKEYCRLYELNIQGLDSVLTCFGLQQLKKDARPHCLQLSEALRICVP